MISFYDIDSNYVNWLKKFDKQVPNIEYSGNNKFLCGVVIELNGDKFYAPISSNRKIYRTSFPIYDETSHQILSTIRFCFMIPALTSVLQIKDFTQIRATDMQYAQLLQKEWRYCQKHEVDIHKAAQRAYNIGCNPAHKLYYTCCKFNILQSEYKRYFQ